MSWWYRRLVRPVLFTQDAEQIHKRVMHALAWTSSHDLACEALQSFFGAPSIPTELFGLNFPNPVGLAAGMDKYADALPVWAALGFGFTELGGTTWHSQSGNPPPRLFRAVADAAIVNRMGFNNPGAEAIRQRLEEWRAAGPWPKHPVGINLGKSKVTPLEQAPDEYANLFCLLRPYADFFVVNVSSPNTPGLRKLQDKGALDEILAAIQQKQEPNGQKVSHSQAEGRLSSETANVNRTQSKPVLIKVAPDLSFEALDEILELIEPRAVAGIVATNTTVNRPPTEDLNLRRIYDEPGGLSGRPLQARSTEIVRHVYRQSRGKLPIIGVGGIFSATDAWEKITAGASLVQLYTALIYEGPGLAGAIVRGLLARMEAAGFADLRRAVGSAAT